MKRIPLVFEQGLEHDYTRHARVFRLSSEAGIAVL